MRTAHVWVLQDRKGVLWRYKGGALVTYTSLNKAREMSGWLNPKRGWQAKRGTVTVGDSLGT